MYCKFCGATIDDNSTYCTVCGKNLVETVSRSQSSSNVNTQPIANIPKGIYIDGYEYTPTVFVVQAIAEAVLSIFAFYFFISSITEPWYSDLFDIFERDTLKIGSIIFLVLGVIGFMYSIVLYNRGKGVYYNIYENRIQGRGTVAELSFSKSDFDLSYQEIVNVATQARVVMITGNNMTYRIIAKSSDDAIRVQSLIYGKKNNPVKRQPNTYVTQKAKEWVCPNCGKENQSYVGTCGCGTRKP